MYFPGWNSGANSITLQGFWAELPGVMENFATETAVEGDSVILHLTFTCL